MAGTALAACLGVALVALVFALHALLEPLLGAAGATAAVIALAALAIAAGGLAAQLMLRPRRARVGGQPTTALVDRVLIFVRDRPVVSMAGAVGAGAVVIANPLFVARLARAFLARRRDDD